MADELVLGAGDADKEFEETFDEGDGMSHTITHLSLI